jgi:hypothetical protein
MKIKLIAFASILFLLVTFSACKKGYLDVNPDNRTEINTVQKVAQLTGTAYPSYDYLTFTEAASDNSEDKGPGIGSVNDLITTYYTWQDFVGGSTNSADNYWNGCYEAIAAANQALESMEKGNFGPEILPYKGEALVARAYAHHMLAMFFAKTYKPKGDNSSPGIPYVTKPETVLLAKYSRGTVQSIYDDIEKDLLEGIKLLDDSKYSVPKYHFTKAAANAFAARFYLFKGEWQKVIDYASATVPSGDWKNNLRPIATDYKTSGYQQVHLDFTKSNQKSTLLLANNYSTYQRIYTTPRYGYGATLVKMFSDVNVTGKNVQNFIINYGLPNYTTYKWNEYFFYATASTGYPYLPVILLTVDETLMNRAEAYAELKQNTQALKDIDAFYSVRLSGYNPTKDAVTLDKIRAFYSIDDPTNGIVRTILDAKKAEFLQEGIRWMDIIRRDLPAKKNLYDPSGEESFIELAPNDLRRVFQIPESVKLAGLEQNAR